MKFIFCMDLKVTRKKESDNVAKGGDDLILLGEDTDYPQMEWRFPDINGCPKMYCTAIFDDRFFAMAHYRVVHAKTDLLCLECNTLISMNNPDDLIRHYERKHPSAPAPLPKTTTTTASAPATSVSAEVPVSCNQVDDSNKPTPDNQTNRRDLPPSNKRKGNLKRSDRIANKKKKSITFADVRISLCFLNFISDQFIIGFLFDIFRELENLHQQSPFVLTSQSIRIRY